MQVPDLLVSAVLQDDQAVNGGKGMKGLVGPFCLSSVASGLRLSKCCLCALSTAYRSAYSLLYCSVPVGESHYVTAATLAACIILGMISHIALHL